MPIIPAIQIIYPENKRVPASRIIDWAKDAVADGNDLFPIETFADAVFILSDLGLVTFHSSIQEILDGPEAHEKLVTL